MLFLMFTTILVALFALNAALAAILNGTFPFGKANGTVFPVPTGNTIFSIK